MRLRRLRIDQLPGIRAGFEIDELDAGLNVVLGPNASGKSSICRAIRAMLYGEPVDGAVSLEADFEDANGTVRVVRQGGEIVWTRDGRPVSPAPLPDEDVVSCFTIQVEQLLMAGRTERLLSRRVGRILAGGYDLDAVRRSEPFCTRPRHASREDHALREAQRALTETNRNQREIRQTEQDLEDLRARTELAARAVKRLDATKTAIRLLNARRSVAVIREERSRFPEGMERLTGEEADRLQTLKRTSFGRTERIRQIDGEILEANSELNRSGLESSELNATVLAERDRAVDDLRALEQELATVQADLAAAHGERADALRELGGEEPTRDLAIEPQVVAGVERDLDRRRELIAHKRGIEEQLALLDPAEPDDALFQRVRDARRTLAQWLAAPPRVIPWVLVLDVVASGAIVTLALRVHWAFWPALLLVVAASVPLLRPRGASPDSREDAKRRFGETDAPEPEGWDAEAVRRRLEELDTEIATGERARFDADRRKGLERQLADVCTGLAELTRDLSSLAREVGFDPETLDASFQRWLHLVARHDDARCRVRERTAQAEGLTARVNASRVSLLEFLRSFDESPGDSTVRAESLAEALRHIEERVRQRDSARVILDRARGSRELAIKESTETQNEIATLFHRAGLEPGAESDLDARLPQLAEWQRLGDELSDAVAIARETEQLLGDDTELRALVDANDETELKRRLDETEALAAEHEDLARRVSRIEERVDASKAGHDLEDARAAVARSREQLKERLHEERFAAAAEFLLDDVLKEHVVVSRPAVLQRAEQWFARFTNHQFALVSPTGADGEFLARETSAAEIRTLDQLSSGTRMQLLLALRLAFALENERGREPLPFFLDEALTVADPGRFRAVVECMQEFSRREGRQVFYLTAQPHDLVTWSDPNQRPKQIRLDEIRRLAESIPEPSALELPPVENVPSSDGLDPAEYGAMLEVPRIRLWDAPEAVHLFHLLRDELPLLERLLRRGLRTVGQIREVLRSVVAPAILNPAQTADLHWKTIALDAFFEAGRRGRGRPVDRAVLQRAGVSATFLGRLASLAEEVDGDGEALFRMIDAKHDDRTKRFGAKQYEQLRDYCLEHGHLDSRSKLELPEIELQILAALARDLGAGTVSNDAVGSVTRALAATVTPALLPASGA